MCNIKNQEFSLLQSCTNYFNNIEKTIILLLIYHNIPHLLFVEQIFMGILTFLIIFKKSYIQNTVIMDYKYLLGITFM